MADLGNSAREPKASRVRVWQAADRVLRSGRRPTVEGIRELLGGGSPNSVTAYLNDWYRELGGRLVSAETPLAGFPAEAVSLMTELWRLAAADQRSAGRTEADTASRASDAERDALRAEAKALLTLNQELQRHRASVEKSLAETRALLVRREAALEEERSEAALREQSLVQTRMELEVALERLRLAPSRARGETARRQKAHARPATAPRKAPRKRAATGRKRPVKKAVRRVLAKKVGRPGRRGPSPRKR